MQISINLFSYKIDQMQGIKKKFSLINKQIFSKHDLEIFLNKIPEEKTLYDLTRKGKVIKVIKKDSWYLNMLYPKIIHPIVLGATYCNYQNYLFGGLFVYNQYGFTDQVANKYTILSSELYGTKKIIDTFFIFKKVKPDLLYGGKEKMIDGIYVRVMIPERAFIEFCRENRSKITLLKEIYEQKIDKPLFEKLLNKYPYQTIKNFIQDNIVSCK